MWRALPAWPALVPTLVALVLITIPGLGTLDYHACLILAPIVGLCAGHLVLRGPARLTDWLALVLAPLAALWFAAYWLPNCNLLYGSWFYVLGPGCSALVGAAWGRLASWLPVGPWLRVGAFWLLVLLSLVRPALHFYWNPQVFAFHGLVGWLAGALYEDAVTVRWPYIAYRLLDVAVWGPLLALPSPPLAALRTSAHARLLLALVIVAAVVSELRAGPERWRVTTTQIAAEALPVQVRVPAEGGVPALVLHLPAGPRWTWARTLLAEDVAFRAWQLRRWFGKAPTATIDVFLYPDADSKRDWMGAERVDMAKPWLRQVHMALPEYGASVLAHELAHVFASVAAPPPFAVPLRHGLIPDAVLIEGVAVAAEWPVRGGLDPHQQARAMRLLGLAPDLRTLFSPVGFFGQSSDRAYTLAGSFLRWLATTHGMPAVLRLYETADVEVATHLSLDELTLAWGVFVDDPRLHPLAAADIDRARARFERPGLFAQPCALEVGRCEVRAHQFWRTGRDLRAHAAWKSLVERVAAASGGAVAPDLTQAWAVSRFRAGETESALALLDQLAALPEATTKTTGPALNRLQRAQVWLLRGDLRLQAGDLAGALADWRDAAGLPVGEGTLRLLEVKRALLAQPDDLQFVQRVLAAGGPPIDAERMIDEFHASRPDQPVAAYLWARMHLLRDRPEEAAAVLHKTWPQLEKLTWTGRETARLLALDDARHGRCDRLAVWAALQFSTPAWWLPEYEARCRWARRASPTP